MNNKEEELESAIVDINSVEIKGMKLIVPVSSQFRGRLLPMSRRGRILKVKRIIMRQSGER